jgi:hypothetical protein
MAAFSRSVIFAPGVAPPIGVFHPSRYPAPINTLVRNGRATGRSRRPGRTISLDGPCAGVLAVGHGWVSSLISGA